MNYQDKKRLTMKDKANIKARYLLKMEEYKDMNLEQLQNIFRNTKLSSTDRHAVIATTNNLMQKEMDEVTKLKMVEDNIEGE